MEMVIYKYWVYSLIDPRDGYVYYVGRTSNVERRYKEQVSLSSQCAASIRDWIKELREEHLLPLLFIVEEVHEEGMLHGGQVKIETPYDKCVDAREQYWIRFFRAEEEPLLNYPGYSLSVMRSGSRASLYP